MDHRDVLLAGGEEGYALSWMDARVGDWVVTPRRGKPIEINALWYNALRLTGDWCERALRPAGPYPQTAAPGREPATARLLCGAGGAFISERPSAVCDGSRGWPPPPVVPAPALPPHPGA